MVGAVSAATDAGHPARSTVGGKMSILFASAMMICVMNALVFATEKIASAADMTFFATTYKLLRLLTLFRWPNFTMVFVTRMIISQAEMIICRPDPIVLHSEMIISDIPTRVFLMETLIYVVKKMASKADGMQIG
jgi:hypothetical protein